MKYFKNYHLNDILPYLTRCYYKTVILWHKLRQYVYIRDTTLSKNSIGIWLNANLWTVSGFRRIVSRFLSLACVPIRLFRYIYAIIYYLSLRGIFFTFYFFFFCIFLSFFIIFVKASKIADDHRHSIERLVDSSTFNVYTLLLVKLRLTW